MKPLLLVMLWGMSCAVVGAAEPISFNRDIRPILSDHCFQCHGPDENKRGGNLRLDQSESARKGGDSGPAIVPGKHSAGEIWSRITATDADVVMPPQSTNKPLSDKQRELLKRWIDEGAEYQGHWSFQRVERPAVPQLANVSHPIDAFIRAKLKTLDLQPNPQASKETLIRRVTLDLTGLPPTPAEVDAYLADESSNAYEKVVDRLLASPHYGERLALPWLDNARYADSNGFQTDSSRQMSPWRDWVINAFNRNQPFDQFTVEQLAGDMLPNATREQILATGFNRNMRINGEGGRIVEEWFAETVIDRVETVGLTWMALSLNCCRCHDHKYDPISQKEFYQFFAYFNSIDESGVLDNGVKGNRGGGNSNPTMDLPTPEQQREIDRLTAELKQAETQLAKVQQESDARKATWEADSLAKLGENPQHWQSLTPTEVTGSAKTKFKVQPDGSYLATGKNPDFEDYHWKAPLKSKTLTGILLNTLPDNSLPNKSLGRYTNGNYVLSGIAATITAPSLKEPIKLTFTSAKADYEQNGWPISHTIAGHENPANKGWAVDGPTKMDPRQAIFTLAEPVAIPDNAVITITLRHRALSGHNIGRFKLSISDAPTAELNFNNSKYPEQVAKALQTPVKKRNAAQQKQITDYYRNEIDTETKSALAAVNQVKQALTKIEDQVENVMVMKELEKPRQAKVLIRGEYDKPGEDVVRALPAALPKLPAGAPNNRLGLAQWLVSREHPLTARVWVNRAWERFFGTGIVKTTENLGSQAEWPSHPELLDWLAAEFMEPTTLPQVNGQPAHAWDIKALDKLIVMSATYQQSARVTHDRDPENRLLSRGPRFRLPAEITRDQALAVSGLLVTEIGGKSVRPYMPDGIWDETSRYGDLRGYKPDQGTGLYRRSMYTIWKRTAAPPSMLLFDAPNREICTVKRSRTNTPLQALALMNEVTYVEASRKLAERMLNEGGSTVADRLSYGFRLITARKPSERELNILVEGLNRDLEKYRADVASAKKVLSTGSSAVDSKLDPSELAAYALSANVLLNLDEAVTRE